MQITILNLVDSDVDILSRQLQKEVSSYVLDQDSPLSRFEPASKTVALFVIEFLLQQSLEPDPIMKLSKVIGFGGHTTSQVCITLLYNVMYMQEFLPYTVKPPNKGHFGSGDFVLYLEALLWWEVRIIIVSTRVIPIRAVASVLYIEVVLWWEGPL